MRYKMTFDNKVRQVLVHDSGDLVYLRNDSPRNSDNRSHQLNPRKHVPLVADAATLKSVIIDDNEISDALGLTVFR